MLFFLMPFLSGVILCLLGKWEETRVRRIAALLSSLHLLMLVFPTAEGWIGKSWSLPWIPVLSIEIYLSIDSLSFIFLLLTALVVPVSILAREGSEIKSTRPPFFYALILWLQGLLFLFFSAKDLVLFIICWEAMLLPVYFLMVLRGDEANRRAAFQFLLYMMTGSSLLLLAVLTLYFSSTFPDAGSFRFEALAPFAEQFPQAIGVAVIFFVAFAVKTPLFPFHAWLPSTYANSPVEVTILLSALLSKAGIYGFLRIGGELFPHGLEVCAPWLIGCGLVGVLYGGCAAWMQEDYKRLLAYASLSHVNFLLLGVFLWQGVGREGAILQAFNHGITITGLFLVTGWLESRLGSTNLSLYQGVMQFMPHLSWVTFIFILSSIALPTTNTFVGEWLILLGLYDQSPILAAIAGLTVILSPMYMLFLMQRLYLGPSHSFQHTWRDMNYREWSVALPLIILIFGLGIYPKPALQLIAQQIEKGEPLTSTPEEM